MLLEFAEAAGQRQYKWDSKIMLAMSVTELGQIFSAPTEVRKGAQLPAKRAASNTRTAPTLHRTAFADTASCALMGECRRAGDSCWGKGSTPLPQWHQQQQCCVCLSISSWQNTKSATTIPPSHKGLKRARLQIMELPAS